MRPDTHVPHNPAGMLKLDDGLTVLCSDTSHSHALRQEAELQPGIGIVLVLEGEVDVSYGSLRCRIGADGALRHGALVALAEPDRFVRRGQGGRPERKVSFWLPQQWLAHNDLDHAPSALASFRRRHLALSGWQPSATALSLARQLLTPPRCTGALQRLYREGHALQLVAEALSSLEGHAPAPLLSPRHAQRMAIAQELLESGEADHWTLGDIAAELGLSVSALQRQFRAAFGCTVFDYLRRRRLEEARVALARGGVSVTEAALQAGYGSPANFATAFRRLFGLSPGSLRSSA
ncbi:helix-turn-helix transcriptional regulator [Chitiniphilus eburneus]|uniref:Helix-turn-helix transcriptional regulator n=1 Tax=Chitiniphilus eburneus TaxID=2571148 RepID=A0A4U0PDJ7_9NEIS|nr:AraC family transcriptional regulator [Chitiniphilus eburneus]TJZ65821.1 helix-turn-helix transcriptional regulator [Chitiniphilus eburneus]